MRILNCKTKMLVVLFSMLLVSGCATTANGPDFKEINKVPSGNALIYLYKAKVYGGDKFTISINGAPITDLVKGGYYPYITEPGKLKIISSINARIILPVVASAGYALQPDSVITLDVEPGKVYYVKQTSGLNLKLVEMQKEEALSELKKCKLVPPFQLQQ